MGSILRGCRKQGLAAPEVWGGALASEEAVRALEIGVLTMFRREQARPRCMERRSDCAIQHGCTRELARRRRRRRLRPEPETRQLLDGGRVVGAAAVLCQQ